MHSEAIISHNLSLTAYRAYTTYTPILAPEGCLLEHLLEDGARSGVPRRAAGNRSPREAPGPRPPGTRTRMRGARCDRSGRKSGEGSAAPGPKIATVERREASVPRTRDAGRLTSAWRAPLSTPNGCFARAPVRLSVLRPPLIPGERSEKQNPGAENASRERRGVAW